MADGNFRLRLRYRKEGRLRYLSHLETVRCMERCIRRAGIPYAVSQGFSPHMKTKFGWALPVGVTGLDEYIDVFVEEYIAPARVLEMFAGAMPLGMEVFEALYVDPKGPSLEEEFPRSRYICTFEWAEGVEVSGGANELAARVRGALDGLLAEGSMTVKRGKKTKTVVFDDLLDGKPWLAAAADGHVELGFGTVTEGKGSLRPDLFCAELLKRCEDVRLTSITRTAQLPTE